jgi:hypothetical protein
LRSEDEVRENLEWLKAQCRNFKNDEAELVMRQLEVLLWVLGHERNEALAMAESIWKDTRNARIERGNNPRDYS